MKLVEKADLDALWLIEKGQFTNWIVGYLASVLRFNQCEQLAEVELFASPASAFHVPSTPLVSA
jgi:hypothetical protein